MMINSFSTVHVSVDSITSLEWKSSLLGENGSADIAGSFGIDDKVHTFIYPIMFIKLFMQLCYLFKYLFS
jgi:hypothetical protein